MSIHLLAAAAILVQAAPAQPACEKLAELKLPHTAISSAAMVGEGPAIAGRGGAPVPARCVVKAVARPTGDSEIRFEVWLPASGWNGKYLQVGNGGWAGSVPVQALADPVRRGYAAAGTDDGHEGGGQGAGITWAIGHPEKLIDFGYRALHETAEQSKAIVRAFYSTEIARNYFVGCSDGGREALMEAQRYPEDFEGIIVGAPANDWSHHFAGFVWNEQALAEAPIPAAKLAAIQQAALAACDRLDGVKDGLIQDPRGCRFDPATMVCKEADGPECLTPAQAATLKKIYGGPVNPRTGKQIYPGYAPGTEAIQGGWAPWIVGSPLSAQASFGNSFYSMAVFEDPKWDWRKLNFDSDVAYGDQKAGTVINSFNPDLRSFRARGGRMIQYHGWGDAAVAPASSIQYYESVIAFLGKYPDARSDARQPVQSFYRLFMVPGMAHCGGGLGPNSFGQGGGSRDPESDIVAALERWVEKGVAPDKIVGTGRVVGDASKKMTRPLCPYPEVARYRGTGDVNDAANFTCAAPPRAP